MYSIVIQGEYLELPDKVKILLSKTLLDIKDLSNRGINYTNIITVPFTAKNDRLLGFPSRIAGNNRAFETSVKYQLLDSSGIVSQGDIVVKSFNDKKGIQIQMAEGYSFWAKAGVTPLNSLILHSEDLRLNTVSMDSRKTKGLNAFVTALYSSTGDLTRLATSNYDYTRPCYYFKFIIDRIARDFGYTIDYGDTLALSELDYIGCLSNASQFFVSDFKCLAAGVNNVGVLDLSSYFVIFNLGYSTLLSGDELTNSQYKTSYVFKGFVQSEVQSEIYFNFSTGIERVLVPAGRTFINFRSDEVEIGTTLTISTEDNIFLESVAIYSCMEEGDMINADRIDSFNYMMLADYNLPDMTCKGFLKTIFKMCFLSSEINEITKTIKLEYLPSQISTNNLIDISDSVSRYTEIKTEDMYTGLNIMTYGNDDDISPALGELIFSVENENARATSTFVSVPEFSASNELTDGSGNNFVSCDIYEVNASDTESKRKSVAPRIVYLEETGTFGINAVFSPLAWGRLNTNHYIDFVRATKRSRAGILTAKLTNLQYRELQRKPIIHVDFLNSNFWFTK